MVYIMEEGLRRNVGKTAFVRGHRGRLGEDYAGFYLGRNRDGRVGYRIKINDELRLTCGNGGLRIRHYRVLL